MLCAGRVDVLLRGKACEACMRHRAQSRVTSRRAIAVAAGGRIVVFWYENNAGQNSKKKMNQKQNLEEKN